MIRIYPTVIGVGKFYPCAPGIIWDLITDTLKWPLWGPTVKNVRCSERYIRRGSSGHVLTPFGFRLPFTVTDYKHDSFWHWKIGSIRATGHRLESLDTGDCNLWFEIPIIAVPYTFVCQKALENINKLISDLTQTAA